MLAASYTLRRADAGDVPDIVRLGLRFVQASALARYEEITAADLDDGLQALLASADGAGWVLEHDGRIVGAIVGVLAPPWCKRRARIVVELGWYVQAEHRRGAGRDLLRAFEAWARERGVSTLFLSDIQLDDATPAGELLVATGYELTERTFAKAVA